MKKEKPITTAKIKEYFSICCVAFTLGGIWFKVDESLELTRQVAVSLNKTNKQLIRKGVIDDCNFVQVKDTIEAYEIADNTIYRKKRDKRRIANSETALELENIEDKILE